MTDEIYDSVKINNIREQIETMTKFNQIEILRILTKNNVINDDIYNLNYSII